MFPFEAEISVGFGTDMQNVHIELQITDFAVCDFHVPGHAVKEKLEQQFFLFVTCREELDHLFARIWNDLSRREGYFLEEGFRCGVTVPDEKRAHGLHEVVASSIPQVLLMLPEESAKTFDELSVDLIEKGLRVEFN